MTSKLTQIGKLGGGFTVGPDGTIEVASLYTLPAASATVLGGVKIGANLTIDGNGVVSAQASSNGSGGQYLVQRSIEGVVNETTLMYWVAPASCTVASANMWLSAASYCDVQIMKNGLLETYSILVSDVVLSITPSTSLVNGLYWTYGNLDPASVVFAKGDVMWIRVNRADVGCADLLVQVNATIN